MSFLFIARLLLLRLKKAEQVYTEAVKILDFHLDKCKYILIARNMNLIANSSFIQTIYWKMILKSGLNMKIN